MDKIINIVIFIVLFYGTFHAFPYIATFESYESSTNVNSLFPIATLENGEPRIVRWTEYSKNPSLYENKLITTPDEKKLNINEFEFFTLKAGSNGTLSLALYEDDYNFWSKYSIQNGVVIPISFRFTGAFVIAYCFLVAFIGTPLLGWALKYYITKASN
jgi:hypothetical protein